MAEWITERQSPHLFLSAEVEERLYRGASPFQSIEVVRTAEFGNMLVLDGVFQTSEKEEFVYHDMIVHVPLFLHPNPKRVLIIGGGDGGAAREAVRHACVESVEMVEIDGTVVDLAKRYFPTIASVLNDPPEKFTLTIGDGLTKVKEAEDYYDVVIVDCSDPIGPGEGLFTAEFYRDTYRALKADGLFVQQTESPFMHRPLIRDVVRYVGEVFPITRLYTAHIPLYPSGMHSFTLGSKTYDPLVWEPHREKSFETKYYNYGIQKAAFVLPEFVKELLTDEGGE